MEEPVFLSVKDTEYVFEKPICNSKSPNITADKSVVSLGSDRVGGRGEDGSI